MSRASQILNSMRRNPSGFLSWLANLRRDALGIQSPIDEFLQPPRDGATTLADVPERLRVGESYFTSSRYLRWGERADWRGARQDLKVFAFQFTETLRKAGMPLCAHSVFRTQEEQSNLFASGRSKTMASAHRKGAAIDLVNPVFGWQLTTTEWKFIGMVGKRCARDAGVNIEWGGDWSFYDPAHWQIRGYRDFPSIDHLIADTPERATLRSLRYASI